MFVPLLSPENLNDELYRAVVLRRCAFLHAALFQKCRFLYIGEKRCLLKKWSTLSGKETAFCTIRNTNVRHFITRWSSLASLLIDARLAIQADPFDATNVFCWLTEAESNGETRSAKTSLDFIETALGSPSTISHQSAKFGDIQRHLARISLP